MRWLRCIVVLCALFCCASATLAQETSFGPDEEGRGFFIAGRAAYVAGRYEEALERFQRSYEMSGRAELLYNVGTAAERAGKLARALEAYREFVDKKPESELRPEVERRILELEARIRAEPPVAQIVPEVGAEEARAVPEDAKRNVAESATVTPVATAAAPSAVVPRPAAPPQPKSLLVPSLSLGASGAALVTGVVLVAVGYKAEQRVRDAPEGARWADYRDDAKHALSYRGAGFTLAAVGAAGAAVCTWWLLRARKDTRTSALLLGPTSWTYRRSF